MPINPEDIEFEDAAVRYLNLEGREGLYNAAGDRGFTVLVPANRVDELIAKGWNIGFMKQRPDDDTPPQAKLDVSVSVKSFPSKVYMISDGNSTLLDEHTMGMIDAMEIESIDLVIRGYAWEVNGNTGVKAYLKNGYFNVAVDRFAQKWGIYK